MPITDYGLLTTASPPLINVDERGFPPGNVPGAVTFPLLPADFPLDWRPAGPYYSLLRRGPNSYLVCGPGKRAALYAVSPCTLQAWLEWSLRASSSAIYAQIRDAALITGCGDCCTQMASKRLDPDDMPEWLARFWPSKLAGSRVVAGVNDDDCAVLRWDSRYLVITTDYVNSKPICLELGIGGWECLGRLVFAANLSDLCGTGATPHAFMVAVTMPRDATKTEFVQLMRGIDTESRRYGVPVVGGDTKLGDTFAIAGIGIGSARSKRHLFLRSGAKPGQLLWVSGPVGSCNAAVVGLIERYGGRKWRRWAVDRIVSPQIPLRMSQEAADLELGRGGTDISDGLGRDLHRLCAASHVGVVVDADSIPLEEEVRRLAAAKQIPAWSFAFGCGGDFQFLVTTARSFQNQMRDLGFYLIGETTSSLHYFLRFLDGRVIQLPCFGHRDARNVSFGEEIGTIVAEVAGGR